MSLHAARLGIPASHLVLIPFKPGAWFSTRFLKRSSMMSATPMIASSEEAAIQLGHYHSARIVPLLLVSVVVMISTLATAHLSHDWEAGRRERVVASFDARAEALRAYTAGVAYAGNGSIYFDVERYPEYGQLSHIPRPEMLPVANEHEQLLKVFTRDDQEYSERVVTAVAFVPLRGIHGWSRH